MLVLPICGQHQQVVTLWRWSTWQVLLYIEKTVKTKFLGLQIGNHINWKNHNEEMIPKLSGTCYAIRLMTRISNINTLKSIYYAYFHFIIKYRIVFGGNSSNSGKIFHYTKENNQNYGWCTKQNYLNRDSNHSMSINTLINFNINNKENCQTNSSIYNTNTRSKDHLHRQNANLSCCQKVHFMFVSKFSTIYQVVYL